MKLKVQLIIESDSGETEAVQAVANLERHSLRPENLGLTLSEAKEQLQEVQRAMVTHQTTGHMAQRVCCPKCGKIQSRKGKHQIVLRTLFGKSRLDSPRLYHCGCCRKEEHRGFSPLAELLTERTAPELAYLENKFAALISYGLTAELLAEVLPTGGSTARRWTLRIYKKQASFGHPVTYEIAFKERYCPTTDQAIAMANTILNVELRTPIPELSCG